MTLAWGARAALGLVFMVGLAPAAQADIAFTDASNTLYTATSVAAPDGGAWFQQYTNSPVYYGAAGCVGRRFPGDKILRSYCFGGPGQHNYMPVNGVLAVRGGAIGIGFVGNRTPSGACTGCTAWIFNIGDNGALRWSRQVGDAGVVTLNALAHRLDTGIVTAAGTVRDSGGERRGMLFRFDVTSGVLTENFQIEAPITWSTFPVGVGMTSRPILNVHDLTMLPDGRLAMAGVYTYPATDPWAASWDRYYQADAGFVSNVQDTANPYANWSFKFRFLDNNRRSWVSRVETNASGALGILAGTRDVAVFSPSVSSVEHYVARITSTGASSYQRLRENGSLEPQFTSDIAVHPDGGMSVLGHLGIRYGMHWDNAWVQSFDWMMRPSARMEMVRRYLGSNGFPMEMGDRSYSAGMYLDGGGQLSIGTFGYSRDRGNATDQIQAAPQSLNHASCYWTRPQAATSFESVNAPLPSQFNFPVRLDKVTSLATKYFAPVPTVLTRQVRVPSVCW